VVFGVMMVGRGLCPILRPYLFGGRLHLLHSRLMILYHLNRFVYWVEVRVHLSCSLSLPYSLHVLFPHASS
jgi:hypothetical protein